MPTESQTRKQIIDQQLLQAGWDVEDRTRVAVEFLSMSHAGKAEEPEMEYSRGFSDYVLLGRDLKPLAVIEAKRSSKDAEAGQEQARQYCLQIQEQERGELPFCFYTNGLDIFFWDIGNYAPKRVVGYPTLDDLERYQYLRKQRKPLSAELINTDIAGRDYQLQAIRTVTEAIEQKQTKFLLVMATGTGKTRTTIALIDTLMRASWVQRALFLVDRIALRTQALDAFKEHMPDEPRWPKVGEKSIAKDRSIYVSTYPTMLNIIRDEEELLSPHFFDLIVVDESHRSIYNTYGEVLQYFNTITLGLTATPTDVIDHNTFKLFNCENGLPSFAYSYEEALDNEPPFLSDFQVMKIQTKFQEEGISKRTISLEDQKKMILKGEEVAEINFEGSELEKKVINKGTNVAIVRAFMEHSIKDPNGVLPGKTIFFCMTKAHARRMEEIFNALYPQYGGELARVMVSEDGRVHGKGGLLDQFTRNDMPRIALSVDMLDTGIDVREIVNLVFAKPVFSYTKFWQMIGRGTRLLEAQKIKPWCPEKDVFLILDCWDNFEYFKLNPKGKALKEQLPLPVRLVGVRIDKLALALELDENDIAHKEATRLRAQINMLPGASVVIKEAAAALERVQTDAFWTELNAEALTFLRSAIQPLFRTVSATDFKAMRFEKDALECSVALLAGEAEQVELLKENIKTIVEELPLSINLVARHRPYIEQVLGTAFWKSVSDADLDELWMRLGPLMKFRVDSTLKDGPSRLNLEDLIQTREFVEFGPEHEAVSVSRYRELVESRIAAMLNRHPVLQKIRDGATLSPEEAEQLAQELQDEDPHITEALLKKVYKHKKANLLQFIRHILGIEVLEQFDQQVGKAMDAFIQSHTALTSQQLEFLRLLRDYIIDRGSIEKRALIEAPFTVIHPSGIRGLFSPSEIQEIVELTEKFAA